MFSTTAFYLPFCFRSFGVRLGPFYVSITTNHLSAKNRCAFHFTFLGLEGYATSCRWSVSTLRKVTSLKQTLEPPPGTHTLLGTNRNFHTILLGGSLVYHLVVHTFLRVRRCSTPPPHLLLRVSAGFRRFYHSTPAIPLGLHFADKPVILAGGNTATACTMIEPVYTYSHRTLYLNFSHTLPYTTATHISHFLGAWRFLRQGT